jgi:hypothetical protein
MLSGLFSFLSQHHHMRENASATAKRRRQSWIAIGSPLEETKDYNSFFSTKTECFLATPDWDCYNKIRVPRVKTIWSLSMTAFWTMSDIATQSLRRRLRNAFPQPKREQTL